MKYLLSFAVVAATASAQAGDLFYDDFDTENGGNSQLNYSGFANWGVTVGTVDLIANGFAGLSGNGMFVDMDGSSGIAGVMRTNQIFNLTGGVEYTLSFRLSGNQRGGSQDLMNVNIANYTENFSEAPNSGWQVVTRNFTPAVDTASKLSFEHFGGDNLGMLIDEVRLTVVPEPSSVLAIAAGLGLWIARRRRP